MTRKPRSDAAHNRRRIVTAARAAFAADGLDLPMREIAGRAGLGVATVYRHFPSRTDLVSAVLVEHVAVCRSEMRAALDDPDPWRALGGTIRRFAERQVRDRRLNEAVLGSRPVVFAEERGAQAAGLARLVERARGSGVVRAEVSVEDVRVGLSAIASFRALPPERAAVAVGRLTNLLLAGISGLPSGDGDPGSGLGEREYGGQ
ncbi:TetR/AcrR family transcriptional regulator [Nonomuraea sp. NPDC049141]|uniref:TetR/AcrR family transcriptional regulator n=1 Tax=unclassified Nonomuraea TaxID=2593643 RepID=UPI00340AF0A0